MTREDIAGQLLVCAYVERACGHALLGWIPRVAEIERKLELGRHQHADMMRAARLERTVRAMSRIRGGHALAVPRAWRAQMQAIDRARGEAQMLTRLYFGARASLEKIYRALAARLHPVLDAALRELVTDALHDTQAQLRTARTWLRAGKPRPMRWPARGGRIARADWLWKPVSRVPVPARPQELAETFEVGAVVVPFVPPGRRTAAAMLHENIDAEISTLELFARCSYEHPDMPEEFHQAMSRQASDEARHAAACIALATHYGVPHGTYPTSTDVYDFHYEYAPCKPGSRRELLWRLLLRSTFQEALSLDGFVTLNARLAHDRAYDAARLLESLMADEVFHVESGLKWARYLCNGNDDRVFTERAKAHRYYVMAQHRARKAYVKAHPDEAIRETEQLWELHEQSRKRYPFDLGVHLARDTRRRIGFTERDLEQVLDWGYALD